MHGLDSLPLRLVSDTQDRLQCAWISFPAAVSTKSHTLSAVTQLIEIKIQVRVENAVISAVLNVKDGEVSWPGTIMV